MRGDEGGECIGGLRERLAFRIHRFRKALTDDAMRVGEHLSASAKGSVRRRSRA
jgi:hypothetical protein